MSATPEDVIAGRARWCVVHAPWEKVLPWMPDGAVAHVIADPPYDERTHTQARSLKDGGSAIPIDFDWLRDYSHVAEGLRVSRRWVLYFCALEMLGSYRDAAGPAYIRGGVWDRPNGTPQISADRPGQGAEGIAILHRPGGMDWNSGGKRGTWRHGVEREDRCHPTQKPLSLMLELLEDFTSPDDVVLDTHAGSGTTGVACLRLGRRCILVERDAKHAASAVERMKAESRGLPLQAVREDKRGQLPLLASVLESEKPDSYLFGREE